MDNEIENQRRLYAELIALARKLNEHFEKNGQHWHYCTSCEQVLPESDFYKRSNGTTRTECRRCFTTRQRKIPLTENMKASRLSYNRERQKTSLYAEKSKAWARVRLLIEQKKIPPVSDLSCQGCGKPAEHYHHHNGYTEAHHADVVPLCASCHSLEHMSS